MNYLQEIQRAIDFIEDNLSEPITSDDVASQVSYSVFHFHRIFESVLGCSVKSYIRRRRLTNAAILLHKTNRKVIDIAAEYQFESQASFTRSFQQVLGITPGRYRKMKPYVGFLGRQNIEDTFVHYDGEMRNLEPEIIEMKEQRVIGLIESKIEIVGVPERDHSLIPRLWERFVPSISSIDCRMNTHVSLGISDSAHDGLHFSYMAGVEVSPDAAVPQGMTEKFIPRGTYAVFRHIGPTISIHQIARYIYGFWLPRTEYQLEDRPELEIYDDRSFRIDDDESVMKLCIPIRPLS